MGKNYYHGGVHGLKKGQFILPPAKTNALSTAQYGNYECDTGRVYITTSFADAAIYACGIPKGYVYQVKPIGDLKPDPDCLQPGLSFSVEKAEIIKRHKISGKDRKKILKSINS